MLLYLCMPADIPTVVHLTFECEARELRQYQQKKIELKDKELTANLQLIETKDKQFALQLQLIEAKDKQLALQIELLKSKDKQVNVNLESKDKQLALQLQLTEAKDKQLASQLQLIEVRDKELALQTELINSYKAKKNEMENENDKEILRLKTLIKEKDLRISDLELKSTANGAKINDLQTKQTEYMKILEGSNCLGKSIASIIKLPHIEPFLVPCDFKIAGSGWIVIQRRMDGTEDFNRNWEEYKAGFGDLQHEYFIGLEKMHLLTQSQPHELYIQLEDFNNETRYARYSDFLIGSEEESYKIIKVGDFSGNAGDSLIYHIGMKFSTKDRDNDRANNSSAILYKSGWWFNNCRSCNLNELYTTEDVGLRRRGISWNEWHLNPIKFAQMMIRAKVF
ncbi:fibrinogen-like protein 1 [Drosophila hydei]|uniref:Fibrinogen-like protein 1 n=1 Tax=Drosophila hydei TaxID=7224 RepID=A0A6J2SV52_DROHY|nr:fibrinogen-like protein 1 [Drosophila hydei]